MYCSADSDASKGLTRRHSGKDKSRGNWFAPGSPSVRQLIASFSLATFFLTGLPLQQAQAARNNQASEVPTSAIVQVPSGVFGSLEIRTNAKKGLAEWNRYLRAVAAEQKLYMSCDQGSKSCPHQLRDWRQQLRPWRSMSEADQLNAVNSWVNRRIRYRDDRVSTGVADRWATPGQSLRGTGDCEDYALLKYQTLRELGFDEGRLRIVVVNDMRKKIGHAVLAVRTGSGILILDNQTSRIRRHEVIRHYAPVYSINHEGRWINVTTRKARTQLASVVKAGSDTEFSVERELKSRGAGSDSPVAGLTDELRPTLTVSDEPLPRASLPEMSSPWSGWRRELP